MYISSPCEIRTNSVHIWKVKPITTQSRTINQAIFSRKRSRFILYSTETSMLQKLSLDWSKRSLYYNNKSFFFLYQQIDLHRHSDNTMISNSKREKKLNDLLYYYSLQSHLLSGLLPSSGMRVSRVDRIWGIDMPPETTISAIREHMNLRNQYMMVR